jgi:hypothetical protein
MLNLEDAIKNAVERICRDRNEDDKIYIHVSDLAGEAIRQHAKILHDMQRANEEAQELTKAKADGRLVVLPVSIGSPIWRLHHPVGCPPFIEPGKMRYCDLDWWGKNAFSTREEAEKALQEGLEWNKRG